MPKTLLIFSLVLFSFTLAAGNISMAAGETAACVQLEEKASGEMAKYSMYGTGAGEVFFSGIRCAIKHRNSDLCAMEMVSFDTTSKVFDYNSGEEIDAAKAFYLVDVENSDTPVLAFSSREEAEKNAAGMKNLEVVDYLKLTEM